MFESDHHSGSANFLTKESPKKESRKKAKKKNIVEPLYSPKKVAAAIGVSESSLKRWCDAGTVKAVKTPGGHRKIMRSEVVSFVKRTSCRLRDPVAIGLPDINAVDFSSIDQARASFLTALLGTDSVGSCKILCALFVQGHNVAEILDSVVSPVLFEIVVKRKRGEIPVNQESIAVEICHESLLELKTIIAQVASNSPVAFGASLEGNEFPLVTLGAELCLRNFGWSATSLGANVPVKSLLQSTTDLQPSFIWISSRLIEDQTNFFTKLNELSAGVTEAVKVVVIGQSVINDEVLRRMPTVQCCENFAQLLLVTRISDGAPDR